MNTCAFWYEGTQNEDATKLNINLWYSRKNTIKYLDLGLMLCKSQAITSIHIFIPCKLNKNNITDLGQLMIDKTDIINNVFNESYSFQKPDNFSIIVSKNNSNFSLVALHDKTISTEESEAGTIINIDVSSINYNNCIKAYLRLRLENFDFSTFLVEKKIKGSFFQSAFSAHEIIDFRINEYRMFSRDLFEKTRHAIRMEFDTIHFLFISDSSDDLYIYSDNYSARILEQNTWNSYLIKPESV